MQIKKDTGYFSVFAFSIVEVKNANKRDNCEDNQGL